VSKLKCLFVVKCLFVASDKAKAVPRAKKSLTNWLSDF